MASKRKAAKAAPTKSEAAKTAPVEPAASIEPVEVPNESTNPELAQHPANKGEPAVEVAKRDPDAVEDASGEYRKVFRVMADVFDEDTFDHAGNINATRQEIINHGLRPSGDVTFDGAEKFDKYNVDLTYTCPVIPAVDAEPGSEYHVGQDVPTDDAPTDAE